LPAVDASTCNSVRSANAAWVANSRACANIAQATTCAISAGPPQPDAATSSPANSRPNAPKQSGSS
jgi:hypothetical protein